MRVFHALVFDENIEGTNDFYTDPSWNPQLGLPDKLTIFGVTDTASATTGPTLTVRIEESGDQVHWITKSGTAEINGQTVSTTSNSVMVGRDAGTNPTSAFVRLRLTLGGTGTLKGHVRLFVTGRGEQPV